MTRSTFPCREFLAPALLAGVAAVLTSCSQTWDAADQGAGYFDEAGSSTADSFDGVEFQKPVVSVLEDDPCFQSVEFVGTDRNQMVFHFNCDAASIDIEIGDVVAGVWDGGYLGLVNAMELSTYSIHLWTEYIPLAEVVGDGEINLDITDAGSRSLIDLSGRTLYRTDNGGAHIESGFRRGTLNIRPESHLDALMQWGTLKRFDAVIGLRADADFEYYVAASGAHRIDEEMPLEEISIPFAFQIDGVPIAGRLQLEFFARIVSETTGYVDLTLGSYEGHWEWQAGGRHRQETGWERVWTNTWTSEIGAIELVGDAGWKGRIEFAVRPSLKFFESIGLSGVGATYLSGRGDPNCDGIDWVFNDGLRASMTLSVRYLDRLIPDMPLTVPMGLTERPISEYTMPWPGDLPSRLLPQCGGSMPWDEGPRVQPETLYCNQVVSGDTGDSSIATQLLNGYSCNVGNYQAPEVVYAWTAPTTGQVVFRLIDPRPTQVNHDLFVLEGNEVLPPLQLSSTCVGIGMNSLVFEAEAGRTYLMVVDGYAQNVGEFQVAVECAGQL